MDRNNDTPLESLWNDILRDRDADNESYGERRRRLDRLHERLNWKRKGLFLPAWAVAVSLLLLVGGIPALLLLPRREAAGPQERICFLAPESSRSRVTLPDGSEVWLNAGSRLTCRGDGHSWEDRDVILEGEAFFDVVRDESRPFTVHSGEIRVKVLGTRFNVRNSAVSGAYEVVLSSGRVDVSVPGREVIPLSPGELLECSKASGEVSVRKVETSDHTGWTGATLRFDNRTLEDVAVSLEHRYNVRIVLAPDAPAQERISFRLADESLEEAMEVVLRLARVRCRIDSDETVIEKK